MLSFLYSIYLKALAKTKIQAVAQLNDTAYLDGGSLSWIQGLADGSQGDPVQDGE